MSGYIDHCDNSISIYEQKLLFGKRGLRDEGKEGGVREENGAARLHRTPRLCTPLMGVSEKSFIDIVPHLKY